MLRAVFRAVAGLYVAYILLAVLILMPAANFIAPWFVEENYGRNLHTDIILFNPFTLNAEVRKASLPERDGSHFASLDRVSVNLSLQSLFTRGLVFDEVSVQGLNVHLRQLNNGEFNFSDLLPPEEQNPEPSGEIPAITVDRLSFTAERISLTDQAREKPFTTHYDGIDITVNDLSTIQEAGKPYSIQAFAESGGQLSWEGTVSIPQASSEGTLSIQGLSLRPFWRFAEPWLNFELLQGAASMKAAYAISWGDDFSYAVDGGALEVTDLTLSPRDSVQLPETGLSLGELKVSDIALTSSSQHVDVAAIELDQLSVSGWSEGEEISLAKLFEFNGPTEQPDPQPIATEESSPWTAQIALLELGGSNIRWRSEYTDPPMLDIQPLTASAKAIRWPLDGTTPVEFSFTLNGDTQFELDGSLALANGLGNLNYELQRLRMPLFNPSLPSALNATLTSGTVDIAGTVALDEFLPTQVSMDGGISDFSGVMAGEEEALTRWNSVRWKQLKVDLVQRHVFMAQLLIHDYQGRVHIAEDGSVNASKVWQEEVGEKAEQIVEELDMDHAWQVEIPEIAISESDIDFMDESLPLPFRTIIGDVNGQLLNLNSNPDAKAEIDVRGSVDGYAPVVLAGTAQPFGKPPALDLQLSFTGVDLVLLTPYSGTYAGYAIERGLLNLDLAYSLENNHLIGKNNVVIDQLKLGDKIDSDRALDLPLELALALLTDINGVIDLKVPVEGSLDDPEFAIGSIVASAFVNLVTKAVTAPFALLANLVGAEDDLQRIAFPAGSSEFNETGRAKLTQIAQALTQRPGLTLIIQGSLNYAVDMEYLQRQVLDQALLAEGLSEEELRMRSEGYVQAIARRYQALSGDTQADLTLNEQHSLVVQAIDIDPELLRDLSLARAAATKDLLVNELGMQADRAVIDQGAEEELQNQNYSGVVLDLDT